VQVNRTTTDRSSDRNRGGRDTAVRYGDVTAAAEQELYMAQERVKKVARLDEARAQAKAQKAAREAAEREVEELQVHPIARRVGF
jgi:multidrug efflux pump subunit AcrA (membrane-fusion protein)